MATTSLENYKTEQQRLLASQQQKAKEQAALDHQKLLKYLPQQTAGQSLGMTESAKIAAYNALTEQKGAADAAYNRGVADLNNYVREQEKSEQDALYNEIMTTIDSGSWNTVDDLEKYLWGEPTMNDAGTKTYNKNSGLYGKLSDIQKAQVDQRLQMYANNPEQKAADAQYKLDSELTNGFKVTQAKVYSNWGNWQSGDQFELWDGEKGYDVVSTGPVDSQLASKIITAAKANNHTLEQDTVVIYGGKPYVYDGNGGFIGFGNRDFWWSRSGSATDLLNAYK